MVQQLEFRVIENFKPTKAANQSPRRLCGRATLCDSWTVVLLSIILSREPSQTLARNISSIAFSFSDEKMAVSVSRQKRIVARQLAEPTLDAELGFQYSVHRPPPSFKEDWTSIFLECASQWPSIKLVAAVQKSDADLIDWGEHPESEKNRLLLRFLFWCDHVFKLLSDHAATEWADAIDPCSGLPVNSSRGKFAHNDIDALENVLPYRIEIVDRCRVMMHPAWGTSCYPTVLYTTAELDVLLPILEKATEALRAAPSEQFIGKASSSSG